MPRERPNVGVGDAVLLFVQSAYPESLEKGTPHGARKSDSACACTTLCTAGDPCRPHKSKPSHAGEGPTPMLLVIPRLVWALCGRADALSAIASRGRL